MHIIAELETAEKKNGELYVTYKIPENFRSLDAIERQKGQRLVLEVEKFYKDKTNSQNGYFWKICQLIAEKTHTRQWDVYLMLLEDAGMFIETKVTKQALPELRNKYRLIKELYTEPDEYDGIERVTLHCYFGCSSFTTREMTRLIEKAVEEAKALGIETLTPEELAEMAKQAI